MIQFSLRYIASVLKAEWIGEDRIIQTVTIDSRIIGKECLFVALKGNKFDAHNFAYQAVSSGAKALLVNHPLQLDIPQLIVSDTRYALGKLGSWVRQQVSARVLAITGSAGKTSVKEMTTAILRRCGQVVATEGNFNNVLGVSLTLLQLTKHDDFAVIELGANRHGEIAFTSNLAQPDVVLINNLFSAHLAGFGSLVGVAQAKGEIFCGLSNDSRVILNADSNDWLRWRSELEYKSVWMFSLHGGINVDFFASNIVCSRYSMFFTLHTPQGSCQIFLSLLGRHNVLNALAASALAMSVGASLSAISAGLASVSAISGRLFPITLHRGCVLLDDSYNSNIGSIIAAVHVLDKMPGYRVMVVSDITELTEDAEIQCYRQIGELIAKSNIHKFLTIGYLSYLISSINNKGEHFYNKTLLISRLLQFMFMYEVITILVKGSRNFAMDQVVKVLQRNINVGLDS